MKNEKMRNYKKLITKIFTGILFLTLLCPCLLNRTEAAEKERTEQEKESEAKIVRVGYYPVANYQEVSEDGTYLGFNYDYLMQIQKYTRWDYEFVQASYAECLDMLKKGEIDVMGGLNVTKERKENMFFSRYSISNSQNRLYAREEEKRLFYESYDTFDGCRIAVMNGMLIDKLETYASIHDFSMQIIQYNSVAEMEQALLDGDVDMVYAPSINNDIATKIVARMDKDPLYFATTKNKPELAEELDYALQKIIDNNPDFYTQMSEKYQISGANATATFTREELTYIASGQKVYVIMNPNWAPVTWYEEETQSFHGIFVDVINKIEAYSGLTFVLCTEAEYNEQVQEQPELENNVLAILADDNSWAVQQNVLMTNHVVDSAVVMVTKRGTHQTELTDDMIIALPKRFYIGYVMRNELKGKQVSYYDTVEECLNAVNGGRADITYVNELVATYYLSLLEYSDLFATANSGYSEDLAFAVNKDSKEPLLSIIDKSLLCIGRDELDQIVIQNSIAEQHVSLKGMYYADPALVISLAVGSVLVLAGIVVVVHFVLSRKKMTELRLEKEFETSSARTEFFMMISHEIRTPLNAIVGYLDLVAGQCREQGWEMEYIKRSQNAAKQLSDIAEDMLDYTKIASNNVTLREELFDLELILLGVDQNIALKATQKDQNYRLSIEDLRYRYVVGDRLRVAQVLQNLLSNGVKFTEHGGTVEASVRETMAEDGTIHLVFVCKDTGKGMSKEFLEKVCAPFNQSDRSYSRTHGGLGLGLYLTKYFINAMEGNFEVKSTLGQGSTFRVMIPLKYPDCEQILRNEIDCSHVRVIIGGTDPESNRVRKELLKRMKIKCDLMEDPQKLLKRIRTRRGGEYAYSLCILDETMLKLDGALVEAIQKIDDTLVVYEDVDDTILPNMILNTFGVRQMIIEPEITADFTRIHAMIVEDNPVNADILNRILKKANMEVTICENGKLALEKFEQEQTFHIIFMDIQMPVMDGYETTKAIRELGIKGADIPIVAVSANAFPEDIEQSLKMGMNEHLSKPVSEKKIYSVIEKYCRTKDN